MKWLFTPIFSLFACGLLALSAPAHAADDHGTRDEAVAMVDKADALVKTDGPAAFPKLSDKSGAFVDRDLYIVVFDSTGKVMAHGGNPALVGVNLLAAKDPDGVPFVQNILASAKENPTGSWVKFKFTNPLSKKIEQKAMYVRQVGDYVVNCGVYGE